MDITETSPVEKSPTPVISQALAPEPVAAPEETGVMHRTEPPAEIPGLPAAEVKPAPVAVALTVEQERRTAVLSFYEAKTPEEKQAVARRYPFLREIFSGI